GATWDDMGDLSSGALTTIQISLNTNHRLGSGDVRVRFVGQSETSDIAQSTLYIEYHRIRSLIQGMNSTADVTLTGAANTNFGWSVANAGDVDNDNYDDVIVGAPAYDNNRGGVRLYLGGSTMDGTIDITFTGAQTGDQFGFSIACAGDLNSDGYSDVIIGAPYNDGPSGTRTDAGAVYIYLCTPDTIGTLPAEAANYIGYGKNAGDKFGWAVDRCEDINKDGEKNTVAGAPYFGTDDGKAYILYKIPEFPIILLPILIICILYVSNRKLKTSKKRKK
ncbi:MAG: FG-GAP repeat protein, partial [Thermoplasmata archaeon]|nr:FG-GAP repeat protein [Thermoplasmata archaeon]